MHSFKKILYFTFTLFLFFFILTPSSFAQSPTPIPCHGTGCPETPSSLGYQCATDYADWQNNPKKNFWVEDEEITFLGQNAERARQFIYWVVNRSPIYYHKSIIEPWVSTRNLAFAFVFLLAALAGVSIIITKRFNFSTRIDVQKIILKILGVILFIAFSSFLAISAVQLTDLLTKFFIENLNVSSLFNIFFVQSSPGEHILSYSENAYKNFVGCKNLSITATESLKTSIFLIKITNLTYFIIGLMLLVRQIILWFLIILSPFLAILLFFKLSRNTGKIWIGVFLQWAFYGPLTALFLGAVSKMWQLGIPFNFNFSRAGDPSGFIYPTATSILYGGPSQQLNFINSSNYIDTFAEYIISILMLWVAILLPWWLLRTFRDYCCDGIYAIKNMLLAFYEKSKGKQPPSPPTLPNLKQFLKAKISMPEQKAEKVKIDIASLQNVKQLSTQELVEKLNLRVSKLQDIARIETDIRKREQVEKVISALKQPDRIASPKEREKIMMLKTELHSRAQKQDKIAERIIKTTSASAFEKERIKNELITKIPAAQPAIQSISQKTKASPQVINQVISSFISSFSKKEEIVKTLSQQTQIPDQKIVQIINNLTQNLSRPITQVLRETQKITQVNKEKIKKTLFTISNTLALSKILTNISKQEKAPRKEVVDRIKQTKEILTRQPQAQIEEKAAQTTLTLHKALLEKKDLIKTLSLQTNLPENEIITLLSSTTTPQGLQETIKDPQKAEKLSKIYQTILTSSEIIDDVSQSTNLPPEKVEDIITQALPQTVQAEENIEKTIQIPPTVSIEEYENTKKLWKQHYLKGEVPVSENITSREEWLEQDIIYLTNILNKLLSGDAKLKEEALEDLSYILPLFVINDLSPEELIIYLKARLEAAKEVKEQLQREEEIKEKLKKEMEKEELVEVPLQKEKEKPQAMEQKLEAELPEEDETK